jgi:hypothetical protein
MPEVEPIPAEQGPFILLGDDKSLAVMRDPTGRVRIARYRDDRCYGKLLLTPTEAKWLREALEKTGY